MNKLVVKHTAHQGQLNEQWKLDQYANECKSIARNQTIGMTGSNHATLLPYYDNVSNSMEGDITAISRNEILYAH